MKMTKPVDISVSRRAGNHVRRIPRTMHESVSIFILPSDLPVSLSSGDIAQLRTAFAKQQPNGLWCGFTLLGEERDMQTRPTRASRAVLFTFGTRQPYFNLTRWLNGCYALTDRNGVVLCQSPDLRRLLNVFAVNLPTLH